MSYKYISFTFFLFVLLPLFFSCSKELDVVPESEVLTPKQLEEAWKSDPRKASASLSGMYDELKKIDRLERGGALLHSDFGYPNLALLSEVRTGSMWVRHASGKTYDFMHASMFDYKANTPHSIYIRMLYASYYAYIKAANDFIRSATSDNPSVKQSRGEALAFRAFAYYHLIQMYQFTYLEPDNRDKLGVPIILENTSEKDALSVSRSTVSEVYAQIEKDLNEAKDLLKDKTGGSVETINIHVVNGLLARLYLSKGEYDKAADAAQEVIDNSGKQPYSLKEASYPHFADATDKNVLWGIVWTTNDDFATSIVSWTSFISSLKDGGYATVAPKCLNPAIFASIKDTDVRKAWWFTTDGSTPYLKGIENYVREVLKKTGSDVDEGVKAIVDQFPEAYTNACIKFAPPAGVKGKDFSGDFPLMRIEEMYYILAEAKYRGGNAAAGTTVLQDFVSTYREPGYTLAAYGGNFENEIIRQKQIEFFGEGIPFFDMMRLDLKMVRSNSKAVADVYPAGARFDLEPSDVRRLFQFPDRETLLNKNIKQNEFQTPPKDTF